MRRFYRIYLLGLFSLCLTFASAQSTITIEISNLRSNNGLVSLELFDAKQQIVEKVKEVIKDKTCTIVIENLKNAKYAIRYFHDENSNDELDTNWFGIPQEGYGFSNDAFGTFGPKDFEEWLFDLSGDMVIVFKTKY